MNISGEQIAQFQEIYRRNFGIDINQKEAYEKGMKLLKLINLTNKLETKNYNEKHSTKVQ